MIVIANNVHIQTRQCQQKPVQFSLVCLRDLISVFSSQLLTTSHAPRRNCNKAHSILYLSGFPFRQQVVSEQRSPGLVVGQLLLEVAAAALGRSYWVHRHYSGTLVNSTVADTKVYYTLENVVMLNRFLKSSDVYRSLRFT